MNAYRLDTIEVSEAEGKLRFWRDTSLADLAPGETGRLTDNVLGFEWDEAPDDDFRPAGLVTLSTTTVDVPSYLQDLGGTFGPGTATHNLTLYRADSGALVFGAGTIRWSWGLDANHVGEASTPDPDMQQATVNLFADMGVQPVTLQPGLVAATASTDSIAPVSSIDSPVGGASLVPGSTVTIAGTASDTGGVVGAVDVSVDDGVTWRRAEGRENWTFSWTPQSSGSTIIKSRAVDDSINMESPGPGLTVTVEPPTGPYSLWSSSVTPVTASDDDPSAVELGVKFQADVDGLITGLRFYKGAANTGTHLGNLWTVDGTNLATATFANETASGWQQVDLAAPVAIAADTTYVASYFAPNGGYAFDGDYFTSAVTNGPLTALASDGSGGNGVYQYSATSTFPDQTFNNNNYWVDVVFEPGAGPVNTPPTAVDDGGFTTAFDTPLTIAAADLLANDSDPDGDPLNVSAVSDPLNGSVALDPQGDPLFTPAPGFSGAAGFTYTADDNNGGSAQARVSLSVNVFDGQLAA